jgi:hypothetical protein
MCPYDFITAPAGRFRGRPGRYTAMRVASQASEAGYR